MFISRILLSIANSGEITNYTDKIIFKALFKVAAQEFKNIFQKEIFPFNCSSLKFKFRKFPDTDFVQCYVILVCVGTKLKLKFYFM